MSQLSANDDRRDRPQTSSRPDPEAAILASAPARISDRVDELRSAVTEARLASAPGETPRVRFRPLAGEPPFTGPERETIQALIRLYGKLPLPAREPATGDADDIAFQLLRDSASSAPTDPEIRLGDTGPSMPAIGQHDGDATSKKDGEGVPPEKPDTSTAAAAALQKYFRRPR